MFLYIFSSKDGYYAQLLTSIEKGMDQWQCKRRGTIMCGGAQQQHLSRYPKVRNDAPLTLLKRHASQNYESILSSVLSQSPPNR